MWSGLTDKQTRDGKLKTSKGVKAANKLKEFAYKETTVQKEIEQSEEERKRGRERKTERIGKERRKQSTQRSRTNRDFKTN